MQYEIYKNYDYNKLVNALNNAEEKRDKFLKEAREQSNLISFLIKELKARLQEPEFYSVDNAPSLKSIRAQILKMPQDEIAKIKAEVNKEMFGS